MNSFQTKLVRSLFGGQLFFIAVIVATFSFFSCSPITFGHIRYNKDQLKPLLDSGAAGFILQTHAPDAKNSKDPLGLTIFSYRRNSTTPLRTDILNHNLNDFTSTGRGRVVIGNNRVRRADIESALKGADGNIDPNFHHILFIPYVRGNNLVYQIIAFKDETTILTSNITISPSGTSKIYGKKFWKKIKSGIESEPCPPKPCWDFDSK